MKYICMTSFGESSWAAAMRCVEAHGVENTIQLFADTLWEDEDTYAWGRAAAKVVGAELVEIQDGRDIWSLFKDEKFLGNNQVALCSRVLKRELCRKYVEEHYPNPASATIVLGIHFQEADRLPAICEGWSPYSVWAPLCDRPYLFPQDVRSLAKKNGLWVQRLYREGFSHANCGGACVRAGHAQWLLLLRTNRPRYLMAEGREEEIRQLIGKDVAILTEVVNGQKKPLSLRELRRRQDKRPKGILKMIEEMGPGSVGCGCFTDP